MTGFNKYPAAPLVRHLIIKASDFNSDKIRNFMDFLFLKCSIKSNAFNSGSIMGVITTSTSFSSKYCNAL